MSWQLSKKQLEAIPGIDDSGHPIPVSLQKRLVATDAQGHLAKKVLEEMKNSGAHDCHDYFWDRFREERIL